MKLRNIFLTIFIVWSAALSLSLAFNIHQNNLEEIEIGKNSAKSFFRHIVITREWNASHGGVYVPVTHETVPNPYLKVLNRDIRTRKGKLLTLINPAYMTRQISEIADKKGRVKFHITSLKPIRPANAPAKWEKIALQSFGQGQAELVTLFWNKGKKYLHYMAPLFTKKVCLKCHEKQGYKIGDIRGGISVTLPPLKTSSHLMLILTHLFVWLLGFLGLAQTYRTLHTKEDELVTAKVKAEDADRAKSSFLANMSHEIRTPLTGIKGFIEQLEETDLTPLQYDYLSIVHANTENLMSIINDILDLSKIDTNKIDIETIDFNPLDEFLPIIFLFSEEACRKKIRFLTFIDPALPPLVKGDPLRIKQVMGNLMSNAIKFTPEGGIVSLQLNWDDGDTGPSTIEFSITDTGIGISPDKQSDIFTPFEQGDTSTARHYGGTGLGLSISSRLVTLMGGKLSLESVPGKGSRFFFSLTLQNSITGGRPGYTHPGEGTQVFLVTKGTEMEEERTILRRYCTGMGLNLIEGESIKKSLSIDTVPILLYGPGFSSIVELLKNKVTTHSPRTIIIAHKFESDDVKKLVPAEMTILYHPLTPSKIFDALQGKPEQLIDGTFPGAEGPSSGKAPRYNASVLVADDSETNRMLISHMLAAFGIKAEGASDGDEAYQKCIQKKYDIIFMDMKMPGQDGEETVRKLRDYEKEHNIVPAPVVAFTAGVTSKEKDHIISVGMNNILTKPIIKQELTDILEMYLSSTLITENRVEQKEKITDTDSFVSIRSDTLYNIEKVAREINLSGEDLKSIIDDFFIEVDSTLISIDGAIQGKNYDKLYQHSHKLKGAAVNLRMTLITSILSAIEDAIDNNKDFDYGKAARDLKETCTLYKNICNRK